MQKRKWIDTPQGRYAKKRMKRLNVAYRKEFVEEFRNACSKIGKPQSVVIKECMSCIIEQVQNEYA